MSSVETQTAPEDDAPAGPTLAEQVAEEMRDSPLELPGFPEAVLRIQRTLASPDWSADDVVKILSAEPNLAARALRIANSVAMRRREGEITELRTAVNRMGANLMRSVAIAFAICQLRLRESYSARSRARIEQIWRQSLEVSSISFVLARHCTDVNADQAMLAGLLHVLGRLYIVMRAEGVGGGVDARVLEAAESEQAVIGKAILESWGLPEALQHAIEHQDDLGYRGEAVSLTDVLIAARFLAAEAPESDHRCPTLERIAAVKGKHPREVLETHAEDLRGLTGSLA